MILSYHPCFTADENRICAGRSPDRTDLAAIRKAKAVILPQGCLPPLYTMARQNCPRVFPNYDIRFEYPGKTGQIRLFQRMNIPHPASAAYTDTVMYRAQVGQADLPAGFDFPVVFKFDWGGEGDTVYLVQHRDDLEKQFQMAIKCEKSGQKGFILQTFIPTAGRVLRVVRIGNSFRTYWRVAQNPDQFPVNLSCGAIIDYESDPHLQKAAVTLMEQFCDRTGVNLAGFDFIFANNELPANPLLLEINYFFGREGLGGSAAYLDLLTEQIHHWIRAQDWADD